MRVGTEGTDAGRRAGVTDFVARNAHMLAVGAVVLVLSMLAYVRVPLLPYIGHDLSMSAADLGLMTTVFAVGRLCADIPAGRLSDLRSVGWMLGGAAGLLGAASIALASATASSVVLVASFFLGVSSAVVNTTGMVYFAESATAERRGRSMAGFSAALLGGQALGPAAGGVLASFWGWRAALAVGATLAAAVGTAVLLRSLLRRRGTSQGPRRMPPADAGRLTNPLPLREQALLYFVPFAMFFTFGAMPQTLVPIIGADEFHLSVGVIGLVLGVGGVCRFVGAMIGGVVSDRISRKAALIPALLSQAAGVALLALEGSLWAWVAALVVMSLASFSIAVAATMLVDRTHGRRSGRRLGPFRFAGDLGLIAGPLTASLVYEHYGQRPAALLVAGVLLACAAASAFGLRETRWLGADGEGALLGRTGMSGEEQ
jgi:DHA1 family multidrug resistance protein-like MFS transporter